MLLLKINAIWKNKIAVLVGDFLLSKGMLLCIDNKDFDHLEIISESVKNMSEGELLQIEKAKKLDIDEKIYIDIISKKTASLISSCCKIAGAGTGKSKKEIDLLGELGLNIGIAFQIKDDLFDYGKQKIGKPRGIDIKEKKMTLPLIKSLENASAKDKKWIINSIKKFSNDKKVVRQIIDYVKNNGGLDYAVSMMNEYHTRSLKILDKFVRNNTIKKFGPVREVEKTFVIEVAFDSVNSSKRHKSGVALRFPRIKRLREDKPTCEVIQLCEFKSEFL